MTTTSTTTAAALRRVTRLNDGVDDELRRLIPEGICRTFRVIPYAVADGTVLVAAADADDTITEHVVAERIDRRVLLVRHTVKEIVAAIDAVYPPQETEFETPEARRAR
ncbi:MAG: Beta-monoglucosyldiacylglycerol synthase, partial [Nocardioides sp.]|nr:Beta-monoglucosyldiacylglycerol synthase [Nocardioides sp.]